MGKSIPARLLSLFAFSFGSRKAVKKCENANQLTRPPHPPIQITAHATPPELKSHLPKGDHAQGQQLQHPDLLQQFITDNCQSA
jgi:hypothetical protein